MKSSRRAAWITIAVLAALTAPVRAARAEGEPRRAPRPAPVLDARSIVELTNASRRDAHLPPLAMDDRLMAAARAKLFDMIKGEYFAHVTPDGRKPWTFMRAAGYPYVMAAENLAKGYDSAVEVQDAWMQSQGHRANILNDGFTEMGVADANGVIVVLFGRSAPPPGALQKARR